MEFKAAIYIEPELNEDNEHIISYVMKSNNNFYGLRVVNLRGDSLEKAIKLCKHKALQQAHAIAEEHSDSEFVKSVQTPVEFMTMWSFIGDQNEQS